MARNGSASASGNPSWRIRLTALAAGVLTLGIEIVSGRLLAPFFGSSLHEWAALIGVVLLAYVFGYGIHERLTRRGPSLPLAAGGLYILSLPLWLYAGVDSVLRLPLAAASVAGAIVAAGIPSTLWASLLPYLQKEAGPASGARVLAWSAVGNLAGAWGVAFLGVPVLGTRLTLIALGVLSLLLALAWLRPAGGRLNAALVGLLCLAGAGALVQGEKGGAIRRPWELIYGSRPDPGKRLVELRDSSYQQIAVWDETDGADSRRALMLNGSLQFVWTAKEKLTAGSRYEYYNYSTAAALWVAGGQAKSALILGLGGGLIPWQLRQFFPEIQVRAFELDPAVAAVAGELLPLRSAGPVDVRIGDARTLLGQDPLKYDYILVDTFLNSYVPFHLTTREFFGLARARLNPGGVLVANFHTVFSTSGLLPKLEATIRSVFPTVGVMDLPSGTTLVLASPDEAVLTDRLRDAARDGPAELGALSERARASLRPGASLEEAGGELLTDDRNDTEQRLYETRRQVIVSRPI